MAAAAAALVVALGLAACGDGGGGSPISLSPRDRTARAINRAGFPAPKPVAPDTSARPYDPALVRLQVLLDRARFSPGAIDGRMSDNLRRALSAYETANRLGGDGVLTKPAWTRLTMADPRPAVRAYVIDADDVAGPFDDIPADLAAMARLDHLGYRTPAEQLAEAFHMDTGLLQALNPEAEFRPGDVILVADRGGDQLNAEVTRVEADLAGGLVRAYGADGRLLATYPASVGGRSCPAPAEPLAVASIAAQPTYSFDSDSPGVVGAVRGKSEIAAGPNNPIGVVWITLTRDGYGIHGGPDPSVVGKPAARGCIRLTNWDARELARGVRPGAVVSFR